MVTVQSQASLRLTAPAAVSALTCSSEVHVRVLRSLQPPVDEMVIPAALTWEAALEWLSLDCALARVARAVMMVSWLVSDC